MILAGLLLSLFAQDLEAEAKNLREAGSYLEALEVAADLSDPERERLHRVLILWTAGDLGGALLEAAGRPAEGPNDETQRDLCWNGALLSLQLGEVDYARQFVKAGAQQIEGATYLNEVGRSNWREGFAGLLDDVEALDQRLQDARAGTSRARTTTLGLGAVVLLALGFLARR